MFTRCYRDISDQALMLDLVHRHPEENLHVIDLPHRLSSWAFNDPENVRLWFDGSGDLYGWAVLQSPFWAIDYAFDPVEDRAFHCQILDWAIDRAQALKNHPDYERPSWYINVLDRQTERMEDLITKGFTDQMNVPVDPWSMVLMERDAEVPLQEILLPPGYQLRTFNAQKEVEAYVSLHQAVFQSKNMTNDWRSKIICQPTYRPELNLVIEAPDSILAGFCIGWVDSTGYAGRPSGQIEPLGVLEQYRGLGLSKCLLNECFRRMVSSGAEKIYVETDNFRNEALALYETVGFQVTHQIHVFRRDF
jgi:ribosomal protein S18 acetylase RimI-like enzyme